jgi:tetratricopeptide (TPR) repeat protein
MILRIVVLAAVVLSGASAGAQLSKTREQARPHVKTGWEMMRSESWQEAANAFRQAVEIDSEYEDAYYGLGLASVRLKKYDEAITAYTKCRNLYESQAGRQFANSQEAQRFRRDRLMEIDEAIRLTQQGPQTMGIQNRLRQLDEQRRSLQEAIQRGNSITVGGGIPAFVHLALGSAYFRIERWEEAEREYKAAIAIDKKSGEAYNNLAVLYFETKRFNEADSALQSAERAGFKVHPELKKSIKEKVG